MKPHNIQPTHPCSHCKSYFLGQHYRVYPRPLGSGAVLVCLACADRKRRPERGEIWFPVPGERGMEERVARKLESQPTVDEVFTNRDGSRDDLQF